MRNLNGKTLLITGASSGIGKELAINCAKLKPECLIITARRLEKLDEIKQLFPDVNIVTIKSDLSTTEGIEEFLVNLEKHKSSITHVFNNAGFGWYGFFKKMEINKIDEIINVNIVALTKITKYFLNFKASNDNSSPLHIFNIGSIAGFFPIQGIAMYSATKSFVESFTKSLQSEYAKDKSIFLTLVLPGAIKTEFFTVAQNTKGAQKIKLNLFELSVDKAVKYLINGIFKKKEIIYIPSVMSLTPFLGMTFGKFLRSLGPIILSK